MVYNIIILINL